MTNEIKDYRDALHRCRTEIPNILLDMELDPYEISCYLNLKRIAGDKGQCFYSNENLAKKCKMSKRKYIETKKSLKNKGLITIASRKNEKGGDTSDVIEIVDLWPANFKHYLDKEKDIGCTTCITPMHKAHPPHAQPASKEDPNIKKEPEEEKEKEIIKEKEKEGGKEEEIKKNKEFEKFQTSCFPLVDFSTSGESDVHILKKEEEIQKKEEITKSPPPSEASRSATAPLSAEASEIYTHFLSKIRERKPDFKEPCREKWILELDKMLRLDKRDKQKAKEIISWLRTSDFWFVNVLSPQKLRKQFDRLELEFEKEKKNTAQKEKEEPNRLVYKITREKYPDRFKNIITTSHGILNKLTGKDADWTLPHETFADIMANMIGGKRVSRN